MTGLDENFRDLISPLFPEADSSVLSHMTSQAPSAQNIGLLSSMVSMGLGKSE